MHTRYLIGKIVPPHAVYRIMARITDRNDEDDPRQALLST